MQVENYKLRDYEGDYDEFLEKNEGEAAKMAVKEERSKVIAQARGSRMYPILHKISAGCCFKIEI